MGIIPFPAAPLPAHSALRIVTEVLADVLHTFAAAITPGQRLAEDLRLDHLDVWRIGEALYEACGSDVPDEAIAACRTVQDLAELLRAGVH